MFASITRYAAMIMILTLSLIMSCGAFYDRETEDFLGTYEVETGIPLTVDNFNGSIYISSWQEDVVEVSAVKSTEHGKSELAEVEIRITTNGHIVIESHKLTKNPRVSINYRIKVPEHIMVDDVHTSNGSIELYNTRGDSELSSSNGNITVDQADGYIDANTSNGSIKVFNTTGISDLETSNGGIQAEVRQIKGNNLKIDTSNGSIKVNFNPELDAIIEVRTSNGSININDLAMTIIESSRNYMKGQLGDGSKTIAIHTSNGSINLYGSVE